VPDRGKGTFDRVRGADMFPVLGWEVMERQQIGAVFVEAFHCAVIFHAVSFNEEIEGSVGFGLGFCHPDVFQMRLGFGLHRLGHRVQYVCRLVHPAALHPGLAINFMQGSPERECPIFCVTAVWSMLPERSKDDDDIQGTAGRTAEGLRAA